MAHSGSHCLRVLGPLWGTKRTTTVMRLMSANDPQGTCARSSNFPSALTRGIQNRSAVDLASAWIFRKLDVADA